MGDAAMICTTTAITSDAREAFCTQPTLRSPPAMAGTVAAVSREWYRRYRSRRELAQYSLQERGDLAFAAEVDAKIAEPFWRK
jgi:uncharacterized protein YjiS (DUF1127 family)